MVISKKNCTPACNIVMNGTVLKIVHTFNYLGSLITSDGRCIHEEEEEEKETLFDPKSANVQCITLS